MLETLDDIWMHFLRVSDPSLSLLLLCVVAVAVVFLLVVSARSKPRKGRRHKVVHTAASYIAPLGSHQWHPTSILLHWSGKVYCVYYAPKMGSAKCLKCKKGGELKHTRTPSDIEEQTRHC